MRPTPVYCIRGTCAFNLKCQAYLKKVMISSGSCQVTYGIYSSEFMTGRVTSRENFRSEDADIRFTLSMTYNKGVKRAFPSYVYFRSRCVCVYKQARVSLCMSASVSVRVRVHTGKHEGERDGRGVRDVNRWIRTKRCE